MVSEDTLARLWPILARHENHRQGVPKTSAARPTQGLKKADVVQMLADGKTRQEIADHYGCGIGWIDGFMNRNNLTRERVRQLIAGAGKR